MIPTEIATLFAGNITGFIFKLISLNAKNNQERFKMALERNKQVEQSFDNAAKRGDSNAGMWIRRIIVLSILFGVILAPFIATLLSIPVVLEVSKESPILFGILGTKSEKIFVETIGYILIPEVRQALMAIIGFYFGQAVVK